MANYNSGYKYNSGYLYNNRILYVAAGGNISPSSTIGHAASFRRQLASILPISSIISRKTYGTVGNGLTAIATSIGKKTSKTISSSMKAISGTVSRVSTYFRDVGYQFYYNMGLRYNTPIERNGNVSISGGISKSAMFARKIFCSVNVSAMLNRVGFFNRLFSNNNVTISSSMGKRTSKTVSNGKIGASGTIVKKIAKQFYSSLASSSFLSAKTIFRRLLTGEVSISQTLSKRISKAISSIVDIQSSFNRVSTYFRDVGYQFYYNMGLRYNTPIERNGNVDISGGISKSMQYVRALYSNITTAGILSRVGFFNRSSGNANMPISSNIRKSISKSITAILNIDTTLSRVATFFRDTVSDIAINGEILRNAFYTRSLSAYMDISGTVTKARNIIISAYMDIASGIGKSIDKHLIDNVYLYSLLSRQASFYRSFSGLIDSSSALEKTSQFIRNIGNGAIGISSRISKAISKNIFSTVMISRDAMEYVGSGIVRITSTLTRLKYHFLVTLDGILLPLGVRVLRDSSVDIVPSVKDYTEEIPGRHGEISFKTELGSRAIELHVAEEMTPEERENLKRQYAKHIISEDTKTLVFESDVEKSYEVKYAGKIDPTQYPLHMDFVIPFKMAKPFINGSYEKELKGSGVIANDGTAETPLIIEIKGQVSNPTVVIGDDVLAYNGSLSNDETLVIDTEKQTVKIGSVNVIDGYNGVFPTLQPGSVDVMADSNVTIKWHDRWL